LLRHASVRTTEVYAKIVNKDLESNEHEKLVRSRSCRKNVLSKEL